MPRMTTVMIVSVSLQGCIPYYETHWPGDDVDTPEFQQDWDSCKEQVLRTEGEYDTIEACMKDKGWSKEKDWDVWILETV